MIRSEYSSSQKRAPIGIRTPSALAQSVAIHAEHSSTTPLRYRRGLGVRPRADPWCARLDDKRHYGSRSSLSPSSAPLDVSSVPSLALASATALAKGKRTSSLITLSCIPANCSPSSADM